MKRHETYSTHMPISLSTERSTALPGGSREGNEGRSINFTNRKSGLNFRKLLGYLHLKEAATSKKGALQNVGVVALPRVPKP